MSNWISFNDLIHRLSIEKFEIVEYLKKGLKGVHVGILVMPGRFRHSRKKWHFYDITTFEMVLGIADILRVSVSQ